MMESCVQNKHTSFYKISVIDNVLRFIIIITVSSGDLGELYFQTCVRLPPPRAALLGITSRITPLDNYWAVC